MISGNQFEMVISLIFNMFFEIYNAVGQFTYQFYVNYSRLILDSFNHLFKSTFNVLLILTIVLATFYMIMAITVIFKRKKTCSVLEAGNEPKVTVQIPTYNELAALSCAKCCLDFDYPKDKLQIIIGDDSTDADVSKRIDEFAEKHDIIEVTRRGSNVGFKPGNLNHMLQFTDGEFIVIFDSDFLPDKDFLRRIIAPFTHDENLSVVQSRWNLYNFKQSIYSVIGGTISLLCHHIALPFMGWYGGNSFLCGSAEAIRKKDLLELGGWAVGSLTEDIECSLRLIKNGKRLIYLEDLECKGEAPYTFKDLCKQQMRWAYGVISAFKLHFLDLLRSKKTLKKDKISVVIFASGYMFSMLLLGLTIVGTLAVISSRPESVNWPLFLSETLRNIALTSGFIITSIIALALGNKVWQIPRMVIGSLSVGLVVTYYVNIGIMRAIFSRGMQWYMLNKKGNEFA